ncbi:MAG: CHASE2 domain-containing protein, partial [bacterium]|nr:CHASE2 domain-containing protein [bacterium]
MKVGQSGGRMWGMVVGVTVTLIVLIAQQRGWLDRVSAAGGDWHFRYANSIEASDEIVMIDINDYALERIHAWPWPRSLHADLINTLHDLGASAILLDLVFSEPTAARIVHPVLEADGDVDRPTEVLGEVDLSDAVRDDDLLAAAMHRAGNAYPAMYFQLARPGVDMPGLLWTAGELLRSAPETTPTALRNRVGLPPDIDARQFHTRARLVGVLAEDFTPDAAEVAERLKMPLDSVDRYLAKMKQFVVRRRVAEYLRTAPEAGFAEVRRHFLPDLAADQKSPERQELLRAYRAGRALALVGAHAPDMPAGLIDHVPHGWDATPPLDKFAKTARAAGLVTFQKDAAGGVLRRVPLLVHFAGKQIRQLGFAVACDFLEIDTERITREGNHLVMCDRLGERGWRIPLDDRGMTVLNWHVDPHRPEWPHSFTHIAVSRVMEIALNRKAIAQNEALLALRTFSAVQLRFADQPASCRDYAGWVRARAALEGNPDATVDERRLLDEQIQEVERATLEWLAFAVRSIADLEPESEEEAREFALFRGLKADLVDGRLSERI